MHHNIELLWNYSIIRYDLKSNERKVLKRQFFAFFQNKKIFSYLLFFFLPFLHYFSVCYKITKKKSVEKAT